VRGRDTDESSLDGIGQHFAVLRQDVVGADVRQDVGQDVTELDVTQITLLHSLTTDAVSCVTQQVRLYRSHHHHQHQHHS